MHACNCTGLAVKCKHINYWRACMSEPEGRAKGGHAAAEAMTQQERVLRAKKAATARWGDKPLEATHRGNFEKDFGINVDCYVLNDEHKTAVMSRRGMAESLGITSSSGMAFPRFLGRPGIAKALGPDLLEKLNKPLIFKGLPQGPKSPPVDVIHGYDATLLIDICTALIAAAQAGVSVPEQSTVRANIILAASAKAGIKGLVYALSGYDATREEVIAAFKMYVKEEARKYEQEFPPELYLAWHRLYAIPVPVRGKPWHFKNLTLRHVYMPLAQSRGKILDLLRAEKAKDEDRRKKLFQFLSDVGTRALRMHIGRVLEMAESAASSAEYEAKITTRFGGQQEFTFTLPPSVEG